MLVSTNYLLTTMLQGWLTSLDPGTTVSLRLQKSPFTPLPTLTVADMDEADFTGYANFTLGAVPPPAFTDALGNAVENYAHKQWTMSGTTVTNTIYGYYIVAVTGATELLLCSALYANPVPMLNTGDVIIVEPILACNQPIAI